MTRRLFLVLSLATGCALAGCASSAVQTSSVHPYGCVQRFRPAPQACVAKQLPTRLLSLLADEGQRRLEECTHCAGKARLMTVFEQQMTQAFCGVASATMMLNAMNGSKPCTTPYAPYPWFTQCNVFAAVTDRASDKPTVSATRVSRRGMTLQQNRDLLAANGVRAGCAHAGDKPESPLLGGCEVVPTEAAFRARIKIILAKRGWHMAVNFKRGTLSDNGKGGGHFSPVAAYHEPTDSVLIMDVARYKYPPFWVPLKLLFTSMATRDSDSGANRGMVFAFPL